MQLELPDELIDRIGEAIARHLPTPPDMRMLSIQELSAETGMSVDTLKNACRSYEQGNSLGLRCTRDTPGVTNSSLRVAREWFLAWRELSADCSQVKRPIQLGKAAA